MSGTCASQLTSDAKTIREKAGWLEHGSKFAAHTAYSAEHAKLAHVCLHTLHVVVVEKLVNLGHGPAGCETRVFVRKVSSVLPLVLVDLGAEADIPLGLLHAQLELLHPELVVAIHIFIAFLQS